MSEIIDKKNILEAAIFAAGEPVSIERLSLLFDEQERPSAKELKELLDELAQSYEDRGVELKHVSSGYRFQARQAVAPALERLWEKKAPRYTRAFLETLALVAYRQPITRGEIEEVRGVAVSSNVMRQLLDREWVKIVGHKDVPGKPALFSTTKQFLDYFNLGELSDLPTLQEMMDLEQVEEKLGEQLSLEVTPRSDNDDNITDNVHQLNADESSNSEQNEKTEADIDAIVEEALAMADALEEAAVA
jgi:segregation and condensation protein B